MDSKGYQHVDTIKIDDIFLKKGLMNNPIVDYFSLDVEGSELPILKSLDWDNVNIQGIS